MSPLEPLPPTPTPSEIHQLKLSQRSRFDRTGIPSNIEFVRSLPEEERRRLNPGILRKPTRTLSGVAVVAVMTAPSRCPHGRCTYCPGGLDSGTPQSYTGEEPSALRGAQFGFDSFEITRHRLETLRALGHPTSKVEVILMGGTFPSRPRSYQETVFRGVFDALNGQPSSSLSEAQRRNELAEHRLVSLTVETRPDWCDGRVLPFLLDAGVTRVELGVECLRDEVLARVNRAHRVEGVTAATREARDRGLKVCYHLMPGLPGMAPERDLEDFRRLFGDPDFRPDMIKIYPTLVVPGTELFEDWKRGRYSPYDTATAARLVAQMKALVPPWVRIQRVQRDIPARLIAAGVRAGNLRELAQAELGRMGGRCRCLRCREPGRLALPSPDRLVEREAAYSAQGGTERFLSIEDPDSDVLVGFVRLRFPSRETESGLDAPVIRELKVLGTEQPVGQPPRGAAAYQHRGHGSRLLERAELVARESGARRIFVTAAVGTREYYRRRGYSPCGAHFAKPLFA